MAWENRSTDIAVSLDMSEQAYELAHELNYKKGMAYSLRNISRCHNLSGNYGMALLQGLESITLFDEIQDYRWKEMAQAVDSLAYLFKPPPLGRPTPGQIQVLVLHLQCRQSGLLASPFQISPSLTQKGAKIGAMMRAGRRHLTGSFQMGGRILP